MPRFSVILPTRGRPDWIERAVESVIRQTLDDWELVVLDNSDEPYYQDGTPWDDPRIVYRWERCNGLADASARAIGHATGDIIVPLGDDDLLPADTLETSDRLIGDRQWLCGRTLIRTEDETVIAERGGTPESLAATLCGTFWLGGAVHYRRNLVDRHGGYRHEYDGAADYDLYLRFLRDSDPALTDHVMYLYTDWAGTDSHQRPAVQADATARIRGG